MIRFAFQSLEEGEFKGQGPGVYIILQAFFYAQEPFGLELATNMSPTYEPCSLHPEPSRNLIKNPWPYNPQNSRIHIRNPNNGPRFLNQVPTLQPHRASSGTQNGSLNEASQGTLMNS